MQNGQDTASVTDFLQQGGALRMLLDDEVEPALLTLFQYACQLMEAGEHGAAGRLLRLLTVYDERSFNYWYQLGRCCQAEKAWTDAVYAFGRAAKINVAHPEVAYYAGECYLACGNSTYAQKAFHAALLLCGNQSAHEELRRKTEAALSRIGVNDESSTH